MQKFVWAVFIVTVFVNSSFCQLQPKPRFDSFANFKIENKIVIWQWVYQCPGMSADSIKTLVTSTTKAFPQYTLINTNGDELTFDIVDKSMIKNGHIYKGKIIVEIKAEKYRVTFKSMEVRGSDPMAALDGDKKYFKESKLDNLAELDAQVYDTFDFKKYQPTGTLKKEW